MTALLAAASFGLSDTVQAMVDCCPALDRQNKHGLTALGAAAKHANLDAIKILLEAKADGNHICQPRPGEVNTHFQRKRPGLGWSTVLVTALDIWGKHREGDPRGWSTVLVTAPGIWGSS
jgi:hypothetical protein